MIGRMWRTTPRDVVDAKKCKHAGCGGRLFAVDANTPENRLPINEKSNNFESKLAGIYDG